MRGLVPGLSLAAAMAFGLAAPAAAQEFRGAWHGSIETPTGEVRLAVKVKPGVNGALEGELLSPERGERIVPFGDVKLEGDKLSFEAPTIRARFEGRWEAGRWVGQWTQGGAAPLTLAKGDLPPSPVVTGLDGDWQGVITTPAGAKLRLVLHVRTGAYGTVVSLDSPDQLSYGMGAAVSRDGPSVRLDMPRLRAGWAGTLSADGKTLSGTWTQGAAVPLVFTRGAPARTARPQTPRPPFPYRTEEVTVDSAPGVRLAGTLTLPEGKGPFPAVVMVSGSGAQDRDETLMGHKPFAVIADALTRKGVAVLRYDDRGVAKSTGDFAAATTTDFAVDAAAVAAFLRTRAEIDPARVGLIGHSEGGIVGPMVAQRDAKLAFLVLMAPPGAQMGELLAAQREAIAPSAGMDKATIDRSNAAMAAALAAMKGAKDTAEAKARAAEVFKTSSPTMPPAALDQLASIVSSPWWRELLAYDPQPALRNLRLPVLAVIGSKDLQVLAKQNIPPLREALAANKQATVVELPGLNHLFQTAPTGAVGEYADIEETIAPQALALITDWVVERTRR